MEKKYGFLGPQGTHCEEALSVYTKNEKVQMMPHPSIEQVLSAVRNGEVTRGIVPLENSIEGTVNQALDIIAHDKKIKIVGEVVLPVRHCLLSREGVKTGEVRTVISHPQALAQCRKYLNEKLPGVQYCEVNSTAEAARIVSQFEESVAAIGSETAASNYGLRVLAKDIQDCLDNKTRFVVVSRKAIETRLPAKTSIVFSITDRPGGLYEILKVFALSNINLTKIESRPAKRNLGDYLFFIDLMGNPKEPVIKKCLDAVKDLVASFRLLGTYPVWAPSVSTIGLVEPITRQLSLEEIRQDIDIIDYQIVELLAKRTQLVCQIGKMKKGKQTVKDIKREQEVLSHVKNNAQKKGVSPELMEKIYQIIFEHFTKLQQLQK
jgi:prephenate dehydratase